MSPDIDPLTGLPKELGVFEDITKDAQQITVSMIKKKFGKKYTVITGLDKSIDIKAVAKKLKTKFACGGTYKDDKIELQGDYRGNIKSVLSDLGFNPANVLVKQTEIKK